MAITILNAPATYTPAYNENVFVASSRNSGQTNFRYRVEVLSSSLTVIATVEVFPDTNGLMLFDAHRIIENYVSSNPTLTAMSELSTCPQAVYNYAIKVTERYGVPLANGDTGTASNLWAFNASLKWADFPDWNYDEWFIKTGLVVKFLTNSPANQNIAENENAFLHFGVQGSGVAKKARVRTYDSSGTIIQTVLIKNNYSTLLLIDARHFIRMPSGWNLNSLPGAQLTSGAQPIITSSVAYWVIDIVDDTSGVVALTEEKTYTANCGCTPYTPYRLHFLNSMGGFDSFTFNRRDTRNNKIDRSTFEPVYGSISGGTWSYSKTEQRKKSFYTETQETIKINSDWITEDESQWLYELVSSPEVYVESEGEMYSAFIKNSDYITRNHASDKIFNLEIEMELGKNIRQRW